MQRFFLWCLLLLVLISSVYADGIGGGFGINITADPNSTATENPNPAEDNSMEINIDSYVLDEDRDEKVAYTGEKIIFEIDLSEDADNVEIEIDDIKYDCEGKDDNWECTFTVTADLEGDMRAKVIAEVDDKEYTDKETWYFNPELKVEIPTQKDLWATLKKYDVEDLIKLRFTEIIFNNLDYLMVEVS